ncbi:alpha/beta hydrolase [Rhodococcus olei]|uniref:Alpha/beta hydrolase n=1 Tax=Rhodococcus olei TaxID=2161675 RepID=A0ABP8P554_9NOCA
MTGPGATLARPHVWRPGDATPPLLLLHGTGADEHALVPLGADLAPGAPLLSPRGTVLEGAMARFFRRLGEGVFDEEDLRVRTDELAAFVAAAAGEYGIEAGTLVAVGFSNGANIASSLLARHPDLLAGAVLIAAMVPYRDGLGEVDLAGKRVAIVNGDADPTIAPQQTTRLAGQLRGAGAQVSVLGHPGGHTVPDSRLAELRAVVAATDRTIPDRGKAHRP